eukprot:GHVR01073266.1.p1 GENE.GHVR01073266.1~~GHVR01073266.1.p1  ORF type:complete len:330 (+),score=38.05 GHVR01073266.1:94-1083(+)
MLEHEGFVGIKNRNLAKGKILMAKRNKLMVSATDVNLFDFDRPMVEDVELPKEAYEMLGIKMTPELSLLVMQLSRLDRLALGDASIAINLKTAVLALYLENNRKKLTDDMTYIIGGATARSYNLDKFYGMKPDVQRRWDALVDKYNLKKNPGSNPYVLTLPKLAAAFPQITCLCVSMRPERLGTKLPACFCFSAAPSLLDEVMWNQYRDEFIEWFAVHYALVNPGKKCDKEKHAIQAEKCYAGGTLTHDSRTHVRVSYLQTLASDYKDGITPENLTVLLSNAQANEAMTQESNKNKVYLGNDILIANKDISISIITDSLNCLNLFHGRH